MNLTQLFRNLLINVFLTVVIVGLFGGVACQFYLEYKDSVATTETTIEQEDHDDKFRPIFEAIEWEIVTDVEDVTTVIGYVENTTDTDIDCLVLEYMLVDDEGQVVYTAFTNPVKLPVGEKHQIKFQTVEQFDKVDFRATVGVAK